MKADEQIFLEVYPKKVASFQLDKAFLVGEAFHDSSKLLFWISLHG